MQLKEDVKSCQRGRFIKCSIAKLATFHKIQYTNTQEKTHKIPKVQKENIQSNKQYKVYSNKFFSSYKFRSSTSQAYLASVCRARSGGVALRATSYALRATGYADRSSQGIYTCRENMPFY